MDKMEYLNCDSEYLSSHGGIFTAKEISNQPDLWLETYTKLAKEKTAISVFLQKVLRQEFPYVILTGAGTSAFIGEALLGPLQKKWGVYTRAIGTTEIITHPEDYFMCSRPTLLISFARSGDSPESLATIELADKYCENLFKLNITCNKDGELALKSTGKNSYVFLLPEDTNDKSLAMTSSFTSMLLAGLLIINIEQIETLRPLVTQLQACGEFILKNYVDLLKNIACTDFKRMVFLGSGPLFGAAHESHLKVQELSDGNVVCTYDSFLGFRHGPRAVVKNDTVVAYLLSNDPHVKKYEHDLIRSINETSASVRSIGIGNDFDAKELSIDLSLTFPNGIAYIPEEFLSVFYVLPAQIIGFFKSMSLGLSPDSPSNSGSITRVVQGVKIYPGNPNDSAAAAPSDKGKRSDKNY
jgi:tagatose-6-phosphate ketose/aldose isomerase